MGVLADEYVRVRADTSTLGRQLKTEGAKAGKGFGGHFSGALKAAFAGAAIIGAFKILTGALGKALMGASDLSETISKSNKIFGTNAKAIEDWSKKASRNLGLSQQEALAAAASFGDMFLQIGFAGDKADDMAKSVVELSADLGSFNNLPTADVADRIAAAFRGEYDSLQALVPTINAAAVEKQALATTGKESAKQLTAEDKAAAVLKITFDQTKRAAGDFKDTQDEVANSLKTVKARLKDASVRFGKLIEPAAQAVLKWVIDHGLPGLEDFLGKLEKIKLPKLTFTLGEIKTANVETLFESVKTAADDFLPPVKEEWTKIWQEAEKTAEVIKTAIDVDMIPALSRFLGATKGTGEGASDAMKLIRVALQVIAFDSKRNFNTMAFILDNVATPALENLVRIYHWVRDKIAQAWADVKANSAQRWAEIGASAGNFVGRIAAFFAAMGPRVLASVRKMWADVKAGFVGNQGVLNTLTGGWVGRIGTWFSTLKTRAVDTVKRLWSEAKASFLRTSGEILGDVNRWKDKVVGAFTTAKANIKRIWDGVKGVVSTPITWIKDNVYNKPLVPVWNRVADLVGGPKLKAYASGGVEGVRPGYTPGRDTHPIMVSGGEAIMRPEWTRVVGRDWIDAANAAARRGVGSARAFVGDPKGMPGFQAGGVVGWLRGLASSATGKVGDLAGKIKNWALGGLHAAAEKLLAPVKAAIGSAMPKSGVGTTVGDIGKKVIDLVLDKIKSSDAAAMPTGGPAGSAIATGGWASIYKALRAVGARSFTTYPGHDQGPSRSRDIWPPSQRIADTARRLSSIWYVIYNRRIASTTYGMRWRPYTRSNPHTDHVHVTLRPGVAAANGGILNSAGSGLLRSFGMGGVIREPVLGVGMRSGARYGFGERGPETVTPGVGGGRPITILIDMGDGLTQKVQGLIDDNDEFRATVGRAR